MKSTRMPVLCALTLAALAGCGGGGGDSPAKSYAVNAAQRHLLIDGGSWTMSGSANGRSFTVTLAFGPSTPAPFPIGGATAARSLETITVQAAGQTSSGTQTLYFDPANLSFAGLEADAACSVATSNVALPDSAAVGAGGAFLTTSDLNGCAGTSAAVGTTSANWSLELDTGVVLLCWSLASRDATGTPNGTQSNCVEVAADGRLGSRARFAINAAGLTVSARNF
jgi:hypothetical protein